MSDYTSTYTESTGDTIDTTDFSTEFDAIEVASATKADKASDTLTDLTVSGFNGSVITRETALALSSGSTKDFTSIPSWVKRITVMYKDANINAAGTIGVTIGDSGGLETTGYTSSLTSHVNTSTYHSYTASTSQFLVANHTAGGDSTTGACVIENIDGNVWIQRAHGHALGGPAVTAQGFKELSGTLDRLQFKTSATFDSAGGGVVNILYEG